MKKAYPKYKEAGLRWLKKIPDHWESLPITAITQPKSEKGRDDLPLLSVYRDYGVILKESRDDNHNRAGEDLTTYKVVKPSDLVLNKMKTWQGSLGVSEYEGLVSPAYIVCKVTEDVHGSYLHYLLRSNNYIYEYNRLSYGVRNDQWDMRYDDFKRIPVFLPPLPEQRQIAAFLDHKCALIDTFIEKKSRLIELLKEQKQAIINKAVTKGIDPDVPLKPSGIEWLGDIPAHWEVKKLKYLVSKVGSGVTPKGGATTYVDEGIPLLRSQNIYNEKFLLEEVAFITKATHDSMANSKVVQGDVLLNITGGSLGRCFYFTDEFPEANVNQHVCIIRPRKSKVLTKYLHLLLLAEAGQLQIWKEQNGSGREGLNFEAIKNFFFSIPSVEEQEEIIAWLSEEVEKINETIDRIHQEIALIQEYKTTLIAEAVTGKIDVREWEPKKAGETTQNQRSYASNQ